MFEAMLEQVIEAMFVARHIRWFAGGYQGAFWIFGLELSGDSHYISLLFE